MKRRREIVSGENYITSHSFSLRKSGEMERKNGGKEGIKVLGGGKWKSGEKMIEESGRIGVRERERERGREKK